MTTLTHMLIALFVLIPAVYVPALIWLKIRKKE